MLMIIMYQFDLAKQSQSSLTSEQRVYPDQHNNPYSCCVGDYLSTLLYNLLIKKILSLGIIG